MGTNYFLHNKQSICPTCQHDAEEPLHIGKSSAGWVFGLHVIPEEGLVGLAEWQARWSADSSTIRDEYGETVSPDEMLKIVTERSWPYYKQQTKPSVSYQRIEGPNNLWRHPLDRCCVGHGEGTWDLMQGYYR